MRIIICDDNVDFAEELNLVVTNYFSAKNIDVEINKFSNSSDVINETNGYDIAFLDINMPKHNGFEVAKHLQSINENTIIFIVTAHSCYLDQAMDMRVFRYLTKPIDKQRIFSSLDSAIKFLSEISNLITVENSTIHRVFVNDILYITIEKRKTLLVTKNGEIRSDKTLSEWEKYFNGMHFARPHYSYLVNLHNIVRLEKHEVVLRKNNDDEVAIKISQRKLKEFRTLFFDCFSSESSITV